MSPPEFCRKIIDKKIMDFCIFVGLKMYEFYN